MKNILPGLVFLFLATSVFGQADQVSIVQDESGSKLVVNGQDFMINGMNWDYFPIGTNYSYSLWDQPDDIIRAALDTEMAMLKNMGVNAVRQYVGIPAKWIEYIYRKYGIYTMLNHSFGRYGLQLGGAFVVNIDYSDPRARNLLLSEVTALVEAYKGTPGLLMYLLGNENNYGLFWKGAETEDIPVDQRETTIQARHMYKLFNEAAVEMKKIDRSHPIAMCNGDVLFIDIIAEECRNVDIFGVNMYRGVSFTDAFEVVKEKLNKPLMFTEFGSDAFNAIENGEDEEAQAYYLVGNWKEIYENAYGLGKVGNSIGGFTFQFSDGWWKFGQTENLDVHDNNASWSNGGYQFDFTPGENNMNEEWFGICAKGPTNYRGLYDLYPRAAFYALKEVHMLDPMASGVTLRSIDDYFSGINLMDAVMQARGDQAAMETERLKKVRISQLRADLSTYNTGGERISTPEAPDPEEEVYPNKLGFDHMQSFFIGVTAQPTESFRANVSFNVLGNVAGNPIDQIFYENRGRPRTVITPQGPLDPVFVNRVAVYQADFNWIGKWFNLKGFYRTGRLHWGYEGDFFGLYPDAYYGANIDIYNGEAPFGFEIEGKKALNGMKMAFGPQLWWGANPAVLLKYSRKVAGFTVTGIYHEDLAEQAPAVSSFAVPIPPVRRATIHIQKEIGPLGIEVGGIWGGDTRVGETFQLVEEEGKGYNVYQDVTRLEDAWGGKAKVTFASGPFQWYAQGAAMGLLALGGADYTQTITGWRLKDSGSGNQWNALTGFALSFGSFQVAPNFLWQKPIVGPVPSDVPAPARPRNILDDPFAVRSNREAVAGEILFTYDPTPATWFYIFDSDLAENAPFAMNAGFVYRHHPTTMDAAIGILADGRTIFAFPGAAPAQDLWEVHTRIVSKPNTDFGLIANLYGGNAQANGSDDRLIHRYGGDLRVVYKKTKLTSMVKVDDWGPFDYHRDFNLTFPLQLIFDLSTYVGKPNWIEGPNSRLGVRFTWRSLDQFSPRYCPAKIPDADGNWVCDPTVPGFDNGTEWEFRTYFQVNISN